MMKVLYDSNIFDFQRYGGVSKCFCEVFKHYPESFEYELPLKVTKNIHLLESGLFRCNKRELLWEALCFWVKTGFSKIPTVLNINRKYNIEILKKGDFDILHHTFSDNYFLPYINNKPFIYTIHDMIPELYPDYFNMDDHWIKCRKPLCEKASKVIAISENTKKDVVRLFGLEPEKVVVVHHGGPEREVISAPSIIDVPYFLFVGTRTRYKNFMTLLDAFAEFAKKYDNIKLVCTGRPFSPEEIHSFEEKGIFDKVEHRFVSDYELKILYAHAIAFIYPSLYEGFGLPILEAFSCGCPTVLSNCSCFPEIGGDAALYFDTKEYAAISLLSQLERVYNFSDNERTSIIQKGYDRLKMFTWEQSANKLCEVYKSVL